MTMPRNLFLVRHGESEGNVAGKRTRAGDNSLHTPEFLARHSSTWRLTDRGLQQVEMARDAIKQIRNGRPFDRHYVSAYVRAMETACHLELPNAEWRIETHLRERDYGALDVTNHEQRLRLFQEEVGRMRVEPFFVRPPNGESMADLCGSRVSRFVDSLHRECSDMDVIAVLHGDLMWACRVVLERMSPERYRELDASTNPFDHIHNCQILHYTRVDPETGETQNTLGWMRSMCPTDLTLSRNTWERIERSKFSNDELRALVERIPRMIA